MSHLPTILCVGTATLDLILVADRMPGEDERLEADQVALAGGGNAANAAVTIARLGLPVEFCGTIGDDRAGEMIAEELESEGVGTHFLQRLHGATTAQSAVVVSSGTGSRGIVTHPAPPPPPIPSGFDLVHLDKAGWAGITALGIPGSRLSVDDGNLIPGLDLSLVTWYVPTASVIRSRYRTSDALDAARMARKAGAAAVVATGGVAGSFGLDEDGVHFAPALPIVPASTLGAGDVFHGALIAATARGESLSEAIRFANVVAAVSCRGLDGRSGIPRLQEAQDVLRQLETIELEVADIATRFSGPTTG